MPAPNRIRDAEALGLRARGWTYQRVANEMGWTTEGAARKAVERALASSVRETTDEAKALLLADLNAAKQAVWVVLEANHVTVSNGRVVGRFSGFAKDPDTGETVRDDSGKPIPLYAEIEDDAPVLAAVDRLVKIDQEIAKIYGAYAPTRHEHLNLDAIDAEIARLEAELGHASRDEAGEASLPP